MRNALSRSMRGLLHIIAAMALILGLWFGGVWGSHLFPIRYWYTIDTRVHGGDWSVWFDTEQSDLFIQFIDLRQSNWPLWNWRIPGITVFQYTSSGAAHRGAPGMLVLMAEIHLLYFPALGVLIALLIWLRPVRRWRQARRSHDRGFTVLPEDRAVSSS